MDVEWALDGLSHELFIVKPRPETIHSRKDHSKLVEYNFQEKHEERENRIVLNGIAVGNNIGTGKVVVLYGMDGRDGSHDGADFNDGDVLVTDMTDPD